MQTITRRTFAAALALILAGAALAPIDAEAIPAFARRYKLSCTTCHAPFPRLKEFGDEFAGNGFFIPEEERERDYVSGGDDLLHMNRTFPLAVRFDAFAYFEQDHEVNNDLQVPFGLKLLSGGPLARNVGYYFYFYMSEQGEVAGIEDAYIHFNDLGGVPFDVMVGQFQVCDPLMKRELRLTYEDYEIYKYRVGESPANPNLAYDRGLVLTYDLAATGTGLVGMVVNGNGKDEAGDDGKFDGDKYKNYAVRASQPLFGYAQVGYFFYYGEQGGLSAGVKNHVRFHGPDLVVGNGTLDFTAQYLLREDTNALFADESGAAELRAVDTKGVVAELVISPQGDRSRLYGTLLSNWIESDPGDAAPGAGTVYETYTASLTYLLARNLRGTLEYTYDAAGEFSRGGIGLVAAF